MKRTQIYLDHGATTPVRREVIDAMMPYLTEQYGNPSSVHSFGQRASAGLEDARHSIAKSLDCLPEEVVFTGCGSESDNLALRGTMWAARGAGKSNHLITCSIEHKAILETAYQLSNTAGFDVTVLPVDKFGKIDLAELEAAIRPETALITIMAANNEIGTLQPIEEIGKIAHRMGIYFHTDAIQAVASNNWSLRSSSIDLMSLSPHKFYGPKGIGILFVRSGIPLVSTLTGGGQEDGRRSGTSNVAFAVGAAEALRLAVAERESNNEHYLNLTRELINGILGKFGEDVTLTGHPTERLTHNASFAFRDLSGNDLLRYLDISGVYASSGSACLTGDPQPSAVLNALGLSPEWTRGGLRLTVGRQNTISDVQYVLDILPGIIDKMRNLRSIIS
jgi:cysteine desulfurase